MLQNEYLGATIGVDTAENEPSKVSPKWGVPSGSFRGHEEGDEAAAQGDKGNEKDATPRSGL